MIILMAMTISAIGCLFYRRKKEGHKAANFQKSEVEESALNEARSISVSVHNLPSTSSNTRPASQSSPSLWRKPGSRHGKLSKGPDIVAKAAQKYLDHFSGPSISANPLVAHASDSPGNPQGGSIDIDPSTRSNQSHKLLQFGVRGKEGSSYDQMQENYDMVTQRPSTSGFGRISRPQNPADTCLSNGSVTLSIPIRRHEVNYYSNGDVEVTGLPLAAMKRMHSGGIPTTLVKSNSKGIMMPSESPTVGDKVQNQFSEIQPSMSGCPQQQTSMSRVCHDPQAVGEPSLKRRISLQAVSPRIRSLSGSPHSRPEVQDSIDALLAAACNAAAADRSSRMRHCHSSLSGSTSAPEKRADTLSMRSSLQGTREAFLTAIQANTVGPTPPRISSTSGSRYQVQPQHDRRRGPGSMPNTNWSPCSLHDRQLGRLPEEQEMQTEMQRGVQAGQHGPTASIDRHSNLEIGYDRFCDTSDEAVVFTDSDDEKPAEEMHYRYGGLGLLGLESPRHTGGHQSKAFLK